MGIHVRLRCFPAVPRWHRILSGFGVWAFGRGAWGTTTEEAWHRNLRKKRQWARGIVAAASLGFDVADSEVAAAAARLSDHHGSMVPALGARAAKKDDWFCRICLDKHGKPFKNFGHRKDCHVCAVDKGKCHLRDVPKGSASAGGQRVKPSLAQRQVDAAAEVSKKLLAAEKEQSKKLRKELDHAQRELKKKAAPAPAPGGGGRSGGGRRCRRGG